MNLKKIKLIIGLGNPDSEHQNTYHNVGHLFIDFLRKGVKTNVLMNKSGEFIREAVKKYKVKPDQLLIIHDDADIELGRYKFSFGRSSAGHKGAQSVINHLKTQNFWRLRIGIRPTLEKKRAKADNLVLKKISSANRVILLAIFKKAEKELI